MASAADGAVFAFGLAMLLLQQFAGEASCLDVHFDDPTAGFFIRAATSGGDRARNQILPSSFSKINNDTGGEDAVIHRSRFTVPGGGRVHGRPVSLRARYGPFSASQTVPISTVLGDAEDDISAAEELLDLSAHLVTTEVTKDRPVLRALFHSSSGFKASSAGSRICVSLHVTLTNGLRGSNRTSSKSTRSSLCSPSGHRGDGTCLAEVTLPSSWWPPISASISKGKKVKQPRVAVMASYGVYVASGRSCRQELKGRDRSVVVPETPMGDVSLTLPKHGYRQLAHDDLLHMLLPQAPLYPNTKILVPVFMERRGSTEATMATFPSMTSEVKTEAAAAGSTTSNGPAADNEKGEITAITMRCRTRFGVRIAGVEGGSWRWSVKAEINGRGSVATVTANRADGDLGFGNAHDEGEGPLELFNWLFALEDSQNALEEGEERPRVTWEVSYHRKSKVRQDDEEDDVGSGYGVDDEDEEGEDDAADEDEVESYLLDAYKIRAKLDVLKDDVQAVIPITKSSELLNLAVLTGRQISRPLKVFIVSEAATTADVTLRCSCKSRDESVIKVSSSCTSIYVDGSESRGALSAAIDVSYGSSNSGGGGGLGPSKTSRPAATASIRVWTPRTPLSVVVDDQRLSQIRGWRVERRTKPRTSKYKNSLHELLKRSSSSSSKASEQSTLADSDVDGRCSPRYQQTSVSVFALFVSSDPDSGRVDYYPSREAELDVTDLVVGRGALRLGDSKVANLRGRVLEGRRPGRTTIQVLSPLTGALMGESEDIRVLKGKESVAAMSVRVISGLGLRISPGTGANRQRKIYTAETTFSRRLTSKYQEGLLDIALEFTDGSETNLRDVNPNDFYLGVKSLDPSAIAFAPPAASAGSAHRWNPRVVAIGEGEGKILRISLELPDPCTTKNHVALATARAEVEVKLDGGKVKAKVSDKDRQSYVRAKAVDMGDLGDGDGRSNDIALSDDQNYYSGRKGNAAAARHRDRMSQSGKSVQFRRPMSQVTPLEIGMYVLLAVFCAAIAVFVASCFVYASRFRRLEYPLPELGNSDREKSRSIQNAHDWVYLGKSTIESGSRHSSNGSVAPANSNTAMSAGSRLATVDEEAGVGIAETIDLRNLRKKNKEVGSDEEGDDGSESSKRKSQRLSYVGSEINIIPNPRTDEYEAEVSSPNSESGGGGMAMTELAPMIPPRSEPCRELPRRRGSYGAPQGFGGARPRVMVNPGATKEGAPPPPPPHWVSRRPQGATRPPPEYRKRRMLPPTPPIQMHQRDSLDRRTPDEHETESGAKFERLEEDSDPSVSFLRSKRGARESLRRRQMEMDSLERRRAHDVEQQSLSELRDEPEYAESARRKAKDEQPFSTATYTKSDPVAAEDRFFLPVGYPVFASEQELPHSRRPTSLSPLDTVPQEDFRCGSPLRQSPASALPPMAEAEEDDLADNSVGASGVKLESDWSQIGVKLESEYESESGERSPSPLPAPVKPEAFEEDFYPVNPDLDRPSPPRCGTLPRDSPRFALNPFAPDFDEATVVEPEKLLSPRVEMMPLEPLFSEPPVNIVDSSTFVRQKTKAQGGTDGGDDVIGNVEEEEEETDIAVMDYEQLMSYFESLKESSA